MSVRSLSALATLGLAAGLLMFLLPTVDAQSVGGPDAGGYRYQFSQALGGPSYTWADMSGSTALNLSACPGTYGKGDECQAAITVPWGNFSFYGKLYYAVWVHSNGMLFFELGGCPTTCWTADTIPSPNTPDAMVALFRDDYVVAPGEVSYKTFGTPGERVLVIEYRDVGHYGSPSIEVDMQARLYEASGDIEVHWSDAPSDSSTHAVGIEDDTGSVGLQAAYATGLHYQAEAIRFTHLPEPAVSHALLPAAPGGTAGWYHSSPSISLECPACDAIHYRIDGGSTGVYSGPFMLADGLHSVEYVGFQGDAVSNARTFSVSIDSVAPSVDTGVSCDAGYGAAGWCLDGLAFAPSAMDATSGLASLTCALDGGAATPCVPTFIKNEGVHQLVVAATDAAGHATMVTSTLRLDSEAPVAWWESSCPVTVTPVSGAPSPTFWCRAASSSVEIGYDDGGGSGIASATCLIDADPAPCGDIATGQGLSSLAWQVEDVAGRMASSAMQYGNDDQPPVAFADLTCDTPGQGGWCLSGGSYAFVVVDDASGVVTSECRVNGEVVSCAAPPLVPPDGITTLAVEAADLLGNADSSAVDFPYDTVDPLLDVLLDCAQAGDDGWCRGPVSVSTGAADATSGLASLSCTLDSQPRDCNTQIDVDGVWTFSATAIDHAGRQTSTQVIIQVDATPPAFLSAALTCTTEGQAGWCLDEATPEVTVTDATSGVPLVSCLRDGEPGSCSAPFSTEGTHVLELSAVDLAGNLATTEVDRGIDLTPPLVDVAISCTLPGNGEWCRAVPVGFSVGADDGTLGSGLASLACYDMWGPSLCDGDVAAEGFHGIGAIATDIAGRQSTIDQNFSIDATPPSLTGQTLCSDERAPGWCRAASATAKFEVDDVTSGVDAISCGVPDESGGCTAEFTATGYHILDATAFDVAGNFASASQVVRIDASTPTDAVATPGPGGGEISLSWQPPGGPSAVTGYRIERLDGDGNVVASQTTADATPSHVFGGLSDGTFYDFRIVSLGEAGPSDPSEVVAATTLALPGVPTDLTVTDQTSSLLLAWHAPPEDLQRPVDGYHVYRGTDPSAPDLIATVGSTTYEDEPLAELLVGKLYYRVAAFNAVGTGERSPATAFSRTADDPTQPSQPPRGDANTALPYARAWSRSGVDFEQGALVDASQAGRLVSVATSYAGGAHLAVEITDALTQQTIHRVDLPGGGGPDVPLQLKPASGEGEQGLTALVALGGDAALLRIDAFAGTVKTHTIDITSAPDAPVGHVRTNAGDVVLVQTYDAVNSFDAWLYRINDAGLVTPLSAFTGLDAQVARGIALAGDLLLVGLEVDGQLRLVAVNAADGTVAWERMLVESGTMRAVLVRGDRAYVVAETSEGSADLTVFAVQTSTRSRPWTTTLDGGGASGTPMQDRFVAATLSPDGGRLYVAARSDARGALMAVDTTSGANLWTQRDDALAEAKAVAVSNDGTRVYLVGSSVADTPAARLVAFEATSGLLAWQDEFKADGRATWLDIAVASDERVYASGQAGSPLSHSVLAGFEPPAVAGATGAASPAGGEMALAPPRMPTAPARQAEVSTPPLINAEPHQRNMPGVRPS